MLRLHAGAVAIIPRLRWKCLDILLPFDLGGALQGLAQHLRFDRELIFIRRVLVMAAAAAQEIRTRCLDALGGGGEDRFSPGADEARLLFYYCRFDLLARENEGDKDSLAAAGLVRR